MLRYKYIEVEQPIGTFYLCSMPAKQLIGFVESRPLSDNRGVQRNMSNDRANAIARYCADPDAVFPTPIVVSVDKDAAVTLDEVNGRLIIKNEKEIIGDVIDGQHRLWGIERSEYASEFSLPVVFMFNLTMEEKVYVFSTINSNQKKVDMSLIYQLFEVSTSRSPQQTVHQIASVMNYNENSPFYNSLKMLGKKAATQEKATLSQGTFAKSVMQLISKSPNDDTIKLKRGEKLQPIEGMPLRDFFILEMDDIITKILLNCFNALKNVFPDEYNDRTNNILWKTTGFRAVIHALNTMLRKGKREQYLTLGFFTKCFESFRIVLQEEGIKLTSESFPGGGEQNQKLLAAYIMDGVSRVDERDYKSNLKVNRTFQDFINNIDTSDIYELYDLCHILNVHNSAYECFKCEYNENTGSITITHSYSDTTVTLQASQSREIIAYIERNYMNGEDYESWLGFNEQVNKEK